MTILIAYLAIGIFLGVWYVRDTQPREHVWLHFIIMALLWFPMFIVSLIEKVMESRKKKEHDPYDDIQNHQ